MVDISIQGRALLFFHEGIMNTFNYFEILKELI